jgi:threonine synthase
VSAEVSNPAEAVSRLACRGCGTSIASTTPYPFRCPNAGGDDVDHVLRRRLTAGKTLESKAVFSTGDQNPFVRYRRLLHSYQAARQNGLGDQRWVEIVEELDEAVRGVDGVGFRETPLLSEPAIAEHLGVREAWVKDESGNVSGSHKGRHLMGVMLWLEAAQELGLAPAELPPLAIASCGNAALAAAVVARAAQRRLEVFVPTHANELVLDRLAGLDAHLHPCPRQSGETGDPCYLRFREALEQGALPFTCQGNENGLTLDGGKTIAWEMVSALAGEGRRIDRLFLHVGGGALAASVIEGLREACEMGALSRMPRVHAVQTEGAYPLVRAYRRLRNRILERWEQATGRVAPESSVERSALLAGPEVRPFVVAGLDAAVVHRSEFMWPWEEEPKSIADGILDDETYDWLAVVEGMLETSGWPLVVSEELLRRANHLVRDATGLTPCHTGTAGLAGALASRGELDRSETVAFLVTGVERSPDV